LLAGDAAHQMPPFAGQGLCSGVRDAENLAWKLAAITAGARDDLLDTYQPERDPHVREIIAMAIMMGRTVCITDPTAAAQRDEQMLAARASGASDSPLSFPPMLEGVLLTGSPAAGTYFPQFISGVDRVLRLDDVLGLGPWLITRDVSADEPQDLKVVATRAQHLAPFRDRLDAWMDAHQAEAVLVRPDRYVFGTGALGALRDAWRQRLS
jgi:3-(3-hydroxy-phenyl)propionate hydroxylase